MLSWHGLFCPSKIIMHSRWIRNHRMVICSIHVLSKRSCNITSIADLICFSQFPWYWVTRRLKSIKNYIQWVIWQRIYNQIDREYITKKMRLRDIADIYLFEPVEPSVGFSNTSFSKESENLVQELSVILLVQPSHFYTGKISLQFFFSSGMLIVLASIILQSENVIIWRRRSYISEARPVMLVYLLSTCTTNWPIFYVY